MNVWDTLLRYGDGSWIKGIVILPLAVIGFINVFRGAINNGEKDGEKYGIDGGWKSYVYGLITIAGYIAFFASIDKMF